MTNKTKMWLGVAALAAIAYYFLVWEKSATDQANDAAKKNYVTNY
jgi:hypothetical protein